MKFTLDNPTADYVFGDYGNGQLRVNQSLYQSSLIIFPDALYTNWPVAAVEELTVEHFTELIARPPEVALLGTGAKQQFPDIETRRSLIQAGLNLEVMDTAAACRTYNLLVAEGREVAAAVIVY